jgi:SAM-dependent methyltransferase
MELISKLRKIAKQSKYKPYLGKLYLIFRKICYNPLWTLIQKNYLLISNKLLDNEERDLLSKVNSKIFYKDTMYTGDGEHYFKVGLSAIRCINEAIEKARIGNIRTILDLPCGYGRVLRFLVIRFPKTEIVACELEREAVDFCAKTFNTIGAYSCNDFNKLSLGKQFNLIWVGSLITHLEAKVILDFLNFCYQHLSPQGIVIFTTVGQGLIEKIKISPELFLLRPEDGLSLSRDFAHHGYAYIDYPGSRGYGQSVISYEWICLQLQKISGLQLIYFKERGWDNSQDVFGVVKLG